LVEKFGKLIVNPTPGVFVASVMATALLTFPPLAQVTPSTLPSSLTGHALMMLVEVTALVFTVQVPPLAATAHENAPAVVAPQETTDGDAEVPVAAHLGVMVMPKELE
jgi:hypothetical protein